MDSQSQPSGDAGTHIPRSHREQRLLSLGVHCGHDGARSVHVRSDDFDWLLHKLAICPLDDFEQSDIAKIIRREMQDNNVPAIDRSERAAALILANLREHPDDSLLNAARDLVALWKSPKVAGLPRAERNAAIEESRARLIQAIEALGPSAQDTSHAELGPGKHSK